MATSIPILVLAGLKTQILGIVKKERLMLEFKTIYADRFIRRIVDSSDGRCVARTIYASNTREFTFASKETGVDVYTETLSIPVKAFDVFNPYDDDRNNCYSFWNHRDAVEYAFPPENLKEVVDFLEKEEVEEDVAFEV